jgi:hypothetical protein
LNGQREDAEDADTVALPKTPFDELKPAPRS